MEYVSQKYQQQLEDLAELLCTPDRLADASPELGQLALFSTVELGESQ